MRKTDFFFFLSLVLCLTMLTACIGPNEDSIGTSSTQSSILDESKDDSNDDNGKEVILRFAAMSDVHLNGSTSQAEHKRFEEALDFMYSYSDKQEYKAFDLLLVAGDMTNYGYENELKAFNKVVEDKLSDDTEKFFVMGNHEFYNDDENEVCQNRWSEIVGEPINSHKIVNGYHFIGVSPNSGYDFREAAKWLDDEIKKAIDDDPDKPIFVTQHHHIQHTVYGSADWGTTGLTAVLNKYPQVVNFSGHSHYPINDPRSIHQKNFTTLGCGTLSYFELEGGMVYGPYPPGNRDAAQFWVVEVYEDNSVSLKAYDLITKQFFPLEHTLSSKLTKETFTYTEDRIKNSEKPEFPENAKLEVKDIKKIGATIVFDHATGDDIVHSYKYQFFTPDSDKPIHEFKTFSDYYFLNRTNKMVYSATGLRSGTEYTLKITAINCFGKESDNVLSAEFRTDGEPPVPVDPDAPLPDADFLDVVFDEDGATDHGSMKKTVENFKNTLIEKDDMLGGKHSAKFTGNGDYLRVKFSQAEYDNLVETITVSTKFMVNKFRTDTFMDAIGSMQSGGYGYEITSGGMLEFWICINGTYTVVSTKIEEGVYYSVIGTYDGSKVILYVNGENVGEKSVGGYITYPEDTSAHAMCIGADVQPGGTGTAFFNGNVAYLKIHSIALSEKQVKELAAQ